MSTKHLPLRLFAVAFTCVLALPAAAQSKGGTIKKCQDATGKWHYGDNAAVECARSKVEVLSNEGVKTKEIAAPPTEAELAERERRKDEVAREKLSAEETAKRDQILLSTYGHEDDIVLVRDRKLSQIEAQIKASEDTLKSLRGALTRMEAQKESDSDARLRAQTEKGIAQTTAQIQRHETSIVQKRKEQEQLRKQYTEELERYRELKSGTASKPAAKN